MRLRSSLGDRRDRDDGDHRDPASIHCEVAPCWVDDYADVHEIRDRELFA